jgi:hypothetical protein
VADLDSEALLACVQAAGYLGAAALRHELSRQLGVAWAPVRNGVAEIAGFPRELLDAFSSRGHQVLIEYEELVAARFAPGGATLAAAQRASRAAKKVRADTQTAAAQRARLAGGRVDPRAGPSGGPSVGREVAPPGEADNAALFDRLAGPGGLTAGHPTFTQREAVMAVAAWAGDRLPAETITRIAERFLAEPRAAAAAWAAAGRTVVGTANGGRQAEELGERLEVRTRVVAAWLTLLDHSPDPAEVWAPGTVVVLDEATQVSTRNAERLLRHATRAGAVLVPVGDPAQLGSVGAVGWFAHLVATKPRVPELTANQRQRGPGMAQVRAALAGLRGGAPADTRAALDRLAADGRMELCESGEQLLAAVVGDWHAEHRAHRQPHPAAVGSRPVMMAERHGDAELLNRAARPAGRGRAAHRAGAARLRAGVPGRGRGHNPSPGPGTPSSPPGGPSPPTSAPAPAAWSPPSTRAR